MTEHSHDHCHDLLGHLSEYIDGEISEDLKKELEEHIQNCENCRIVLDTTKKTIYLYQRTNLDKKVPEAMTERLYQALKLEDYQRDK